MKLVIIIVNICFLVLAVFGVYKVYKYFAGDERTAMHSVSTNKTGPLIPNPFSSGLGSRTTGSSSDVSVSRAARYAGFKVPVVMSQDSFVECVQNGSNGNREAENQKLFDLLDSLATAGRKDKVSTSQIDFYAPCSYSVTKIPQKMHLVATMVTSDDKVKRFRIRFVNEK